MKKNILTKCSCGCNKDLLKYDKHGRERIFIPGHQSKLNPPNKNKHHSEETKKKQSLAHKGKLFTEEHKMNISLALKGIKKEPLSQKIKTKISLTKKGKPNPKGAEIRRKLFEEGKIKIWNDSLKIQSNTGKTHFKKGNHPKTEFKKGHKNWNDGLLSELQPNYLGGKSFEPYGLEFNNQLREQIRQRDNYRCQQCFREQNELFTKNGKKVKLCIHHIDYNKKNNNSTNLISLCRNCHMQTNFKREDWINYFNNKILEIGGKNE